MVRELAVTAISMSAFLFTGEILAQTIRDDVRDHVEESLEKEEEKQKARAAAEQGDSDERSDRGESDVEVEDGVHDSKMEEARAAAAAWEHPPGNHLPLRVIHEKLKLDLTAGIGYRGWAPQQYPEVSVTPANFFTWSVGASALLFKTVSLSKAWYESNNAASPRASYVDDAARYGSVALKAAWFLAELGLPMLERYEPTVRYEARSFMTTARVKDGGDVCVVPYEQDTDVEECPDRSPSLTISSSMETAAVGLEIHAGEGSFAMLNDKPMKAPTFFVGGGYLSYLKPYQVTIGEHVLGEYLFSGRFYGGGLALGMEVGGGINMPYIDVWAQLGLGKVNLTSDLSLNELAPEDWLIGYVQGNAAISFRWAPFDWAPTLLIIPSGAVSGAGFFFFEADADGDGQVTTPAINWDVLYTVRLALVLTL